jgi:uncharacterized repeat protein (TIGR03803 family)
VGPPIGKRATLSNATLYGTTWEGGSHGSGVIFSIGADGKGFTILHDFDTNAIAAYPSAGLSISHGILYGTTGERIGKSLGTVFSMAVDGSDFRVLHDFTNGIDGERPYSDLVLSDDKLYGTAREGGYGLGTVFSMNTDGTDFKVLHVFSISEGGVPYAGLKLSGHTLYGTTSMGGEQGKGTIFSMKTDGGDFKVLHTFKNGSGTYSDAALLVSEKMLYGTAFGVNFETEEAHDYGTVFSMNTDGKNYAVLHSFSQPQGVLRTNMGGANPYAGLELSDDKLYGTTEYGGIHGQGVIFAIGTDGKDFAVLHNFDYGGNNGINPQTALVSSGNSLYGTTTSTVFKLQLPSP